VKLKRVPKDGLPPQFLTVKEDLLNKRLSRPVRAEEAINPQDILKGSIPLPEGYDLVSRVAYQQQHVRPFARQRLLRPHLIQLGSPLARDRQIEDERPTIERIARPFVEPLPRRAR